MTSCVHLQSCINFRAPPHSVLTLRNLQLGLHYHFNTTRSLHSYIVHIIRYKPQCQHCSPRHLGTYYSVAWGQFLAGSVGRKGVKWIPLGSGSSFAALHWWVFDSRRRGIPSERFKHLLLSNAWEGLSSPWWYAFFSSTPPSSLVPATAAKLPRRDWPRLRPIRGVGGVRVCNWRLLASSHTPCSLRPCQADHYPQLFFSLSLSSRFRLLLSVFPLSERVSLYFPFSIQLPLSWRLSLSLRFFSIFIFRAITPW